MEAEEDIYSYRQATNGAGPLWCNGSTCLVRAGDQVFASGLETLRDAQPLNNCKWTLFTRATNGWQLAPVADGGRTREPCPMAAFDDGRFFLSANPTLLTNREAYSGPAHPEVLQFRATDPTVFQKVDPVWDGHPRFNEHSYRTFSADGPGHELILFQNADYDRAEWTLLDHDGQWSAHGRINWPVENGKPIRVCYPNVALRNRVAHFCGVNDIVEPNEEWRAFKKQLTGQEWDYVFRRLFYTWTSDITTNRFQDWVELANFEATAGSITLGDLWLAPDGQVHLVWTERKLDERLRAKFFPTEKQAYALVHAVLRDGKIVLRQNLVEAAEGGPWQIPGRARFQVTPQNRLFVVFYVSGHDAKGTNLAENRVLELFPDGQFNLAVRLPLAHAMTDFMTATVRAGSPPSNVLEMLGQKINSRNTISYARIRLAND